MKKQIRNICIGGGIAIIALLCSCKNFLNGNDVLEDLKKEIEYANLPYASVEFKANIEATKEMSPFVGTYDKNYKKTDSIELSYEPKSSYVFIGWKATPEDSVIFEDKNSLKTKVTINSEGSTIVIEPVVCARPTVSFLPGNAVAVEKNTDVIITFSHELNLTDEVTLDLIKIVNEFGNEIQSTNFLPPVLDETKKVIIFKSNPENLISFEGNTLGITVKVPAVYNYLYENTKVCMEKDTEYSYKINQETSTKLKLNVAAITPEKGSMNLSGAQEFNIGQKQILTVNINDEEYKFDGWIVQDENGNEIKKEIYELYFSFDDDKAKETYINVKNTGSGFTIVPDLKQRPQVSSSSPQLSKVGVDRGTDIQIQFNMPMSEESIYWTGAELDELGITNYNDFIAIRYDEGFDTQTEIKNDNDDQYYYGYKDTEGKAHFKNIEITINGESYLCGNPISDDNYFTAPYFQTDTLLIIPTAKEYLKNKGKLNVKQLPPNSYVKVVVLGSMAEPEKGGGVKNKDNVTLYKDYENTYYANSGYDTEGPKCTVGPYYSCSVAGTLFNTYELNNKYSVSNKNNYNKEKLFDLNKIGCLINYTPPREIGYYSDIEELIKDHSLYDYSIKPVKTLILYEGSVEDSSGISDIILSLEYCDNKIYDKPASEYKTIEISHHFANKDTVTFDDCENRIIFDFSNMPLQGIYIVRLIGVDSLGNRGLLKINGAGINYCIIDNLSKVNANDVKVSTSYAVTGPSGEYLILKSSKKWGNGDNYTYNDFMLAFSGATDLKKPINQVAFRKDDYFLEYGTNKGVLAEPYTNFLFVRNIFGCLTIFEMIEHEGTNEIELVEYIPPDI